MKKKRSIFGLFYFIGILFLLTSCVSKGDFVEKSADSSEYSQEQTSNTSTVDTSQKEKKEDSTENHRKLIQNVEITAETTNFTTSIQKLEASVVSYTGYIESNSITGTTLSSKNKSNERTAEYTLRIPTKKLEAYLKEIDTLGNIISSNRHTEDVTASYFDTETRLSTLKIQENRLLELLKKTTTLKDIIELEKELAAVRYEIEKLTGTLKKYDNLIDYSTVRLSIIEVENLTKTEKPKTTIERIKNQFSQNIESIGTFIKNSTVFIVGNSPILLISLTIGGYIFYFIHRKMK